jgi:ABC-2 type transport system permease protein
MIAGSSALQPVQRSAPYWLLSDSWELVKRSLRHIRNDPDQLVGVAVQPVVLVLLFRFFLGGAIHIGGGEAYINFLMAGIFIESAALTSMTTGTSLAADMTQGIIDRFRSLPMFTASVLIGHVVADLARSVVGLVVMILVGLAVGFRPSAAPSGWAAAIGITLLVTFALSWVSAVIGLLGRSVEVVQQLGLVLFLPILASSAFVPTSTLPGPLRVFADDQPFTQAIDAVRALLLHQDPGDHVWLALAWFLGITVLAFAFASWLFRRRPAT